MSLLAAMWVLGTEAMQNQPVLFALAFGHLNPLVAHLFSSLNSLFLCKGKHFKEQKFMCVCVCVTVCLCVCVFLVFLYLFLFFYLPVCFLKERERKCMELGGYEGLRGNGRRKVVIDPLPLSDCTTPGSASIVTETSLVFLCPLFSGRHQSLDEGPTLALTSCQLDVIGNHSVFLSLRLQI